MTPELPSTVPGSREPSGCAFIRLDKVRKVYRSKDTEFVAVSDVSMIVSDGELVSLVGPSGCRGRWWRFCGRFCKAFEDSFWVCQSIPEPVKSYFRERL